MWSAWRLACELWSYSGAEVVCFVNWKESTERVDASFLVYIDTCALSLESRLLRDGQHVGVSMTSSFGDADGGRDRLAIGSERGVFRNAAFVPEHVKAHPFASTACRQQEEV